jgi:hypothetical protein
MNKDQMKNNVGRRLLLQPPARRLRPDGSIQVPPSDDWWLVEDVTSAGVNISDPITGMKRILGYDHIQKYTSDLARDGHERGFLTLLVQLVVQGNTIDVVPNARPGESVADMRARTVFGPELQRVFRRQVEILDRIMPNYTDASHNGAPRTGDIWASLKPFLPVHYPTSPLLRDLDTSDTQLLAEFYNSVQGISETLERWHALEEPLDNYNAWNVLMQRVQHSLRLGQAAVQRFCPDRLYDELVPIAGTLLVRAQRSLSVADKALKIFQDRCTAAGGSVPVSNPMGLRPNGRR